MVLFLKDVLKQHELIHNAHINMYNSIFTVDIKL